MGHLKSVPDQVSSERCLFVGKYTEKKTRQRGRKIMMSYDGTPSAVRGMLRRTNCTTFFQPWWTIFPSSSSAGQVSLRQEVILISICRFQDQIRMKLKKVFVEGGEGEVIYCALRCVKTLTERAGDSNRVLISHTTLGRTGDDPVTINHRE